MIDIFGPKRVLNYINLHGYNDVMVIAKNYDSPLAFVLTEFNSII